MNKPINFICIGAAKSGTTWLENSLRYHPGIFISEEKEPNYFNERLPFHKNIKNINFEKPISWYHEHFKNGKPDQLKGELTPAYLPSKRAAERMYAYNPRLKLIAFLRNPIEQLHSLYFFSQQKGFIETMTFEGMLESSPVYREQAQYFTHLQRYLQYFSKEQIGIWLYDDLKNDFSISLQKDTNAWYIAWYIK